VGRRVAGGSDEAVPAAQFDAIAKEGVGVPAARVALPGNDLGSVSVDLRTRLPTDIALSRKLDPVENPGKHARVYAHEIGHVIDQLAGEIPTANITTELKALYNTLNNPNRGRGKKSDEAATWGGTRRPEDDKYRAAAHTRHDSTAGSEVTFGRPSSVTFPPALSVGVGKAPKEETVAASSSVFTQPGSKPGSYYCLI